MSGKINKQSAHKIGLQAALVLAVCTAVLVVHWPALSAQSFSIDDDQYVIQNLLVQNPSWTSARLFLTEVLEPSTVGGYYQPMAMISLMVDYALGGRAENLRPFHYTSLGLHMVNTALVVVLLYLLFGRIWIAVGAGLLFGLHPMTVEPIAWISERKTLLAAFFALLSLLLYVYYARKGDWKFYIGSMIMYVLALMSKPTSTPLPILMLLMDCWPLKRLKWRTVLEKLPFLALGFISAIITYISQSQTAGAFLPVEYGPERIPLIICHDIVFYPYKIIWPMNLSSHYPYPQPLGLSHPMVAAGVIGTCLLIPLLIISLRWTKGALVGWLIFFLALLPTMQIIGFSNVIASDKFAYLPSIGLLMALTALGRWYLRTGKTVIRHTAVVIIVLILAVTEAAATRRYLVHWRTTMSLCQYMLAQTPNAAQVHNMAGHAFQLEDRLDEAVRHYRRALQGAPNFVDAHNNLGIVLKLLGKFDEAVNHYRSALQIEPNNANIHFNLANVLQSQGKFDEAVSHYRRALQIRPKHANAQNNLANLLSQQGNFDEAISHYRQIMQIKPNDAITYNNLGALLEQQGKLDEAIEHYGTALRIRPDFAEAHYNLVSTFASQGRLDEAFRYYRQVLQVMLEDAELYNSLGIALMSRGWLNEAISQFQQALQARPGHIEANYNMGAALAEQGRLDEAIGHYRKVLQLAPEHPETHYRMGRALAITNRRDEALKYLQEAARLKSDWPPPLLWMARILATHQDPNVRNTTAAVEHARRAAELTKYQDATILETLGVAYAAAGQSDMAVATTKKALTLARAKQDNKLANRLNQQLQRYMQGKP
jgi:tetratricopeptide (TPR) repeat protein